MRRSIWSFLMRVICLVLVFATGTSGIAYASHGGSHGSHCITIEQSEKTAHHSHGADAGDASHHEATHHDAEGKSCLQHSCVAVFQTLVMTGQPQRLFVAETFPQDDLLRASAHLESLHRPPIA